MEHRQYLRTVYGEVIRRPASNRLSGKFVSTLGPENWLGMVACLPTWTGQSMLPLCRPPFPILPITLPVGNVALLKFLARKNNFRLILPNRLVWFQPNLFGIHPLVPLPWKARTAVRTRNPSLLPKLSSALRHTMSRH